MLHEYVARAGRRCWYGASVRIGFGVGAWWLLVGTGVALNLPAPVVAVSKSGTPMSAASTAHVHLPGQVPAHPLLPIPVERATFDLVQRGYRESNDDLIDEAHTAYEWIAVTHGQAVLIVTRDGDAVEVELLEGRYQARHGWLTARQITP